MTLSATCTAMLGLKFNGKPIQFLAYIVHCNTKNTTYLVLNGQWTVHKKQWTFDIIHLTLENSHRTTKMDNSHWSIQSVGTAFQCWSSFPVLEQLSSVRTAFYLTGTYSFQSKTAVATAFQILAMDSGSKGRWREYWIPKDVVPDIWRYLEVQCIVSSRSITGTTTLKFMKRWKIYLNNLARSKLPSMPLLAMSQLAVLQLVRADQAFDLSRDWASQAVHTRTATSSLQNQPHCLEINIWTSQIVLQRYWMAGWFAACPRSADWWILTPRLEFYLVWDAWWPTEASR